MAELAEQALIGAILNRPRLIGEVERQLEPSDFFTIRYGQWYEQILGLYHAGEPFDAVILTESLGLKGQDRTELMSMMQLCPIIDHWPQYAAEIKKAYIDRELVLLGKQMAGGEITPEKSSDRLEKIKGRLATLKMPKTVNLSKAMEEVIHYTEEPFDRGLDFPWADVTRMLRGMRPGCLTYIGGYTGHGKTAAAIQIAVNVAKGGHRVLVFSIEMSPMEIAVRSAQNWGLDSERFYTGKPSAGDKEAVNLALKYPAHKNIEISAERTMRGIQSTTAALAPDLVIVDYLQLIEIGSDTLRVGTTKNSNALKALARSQDCHILALSQLSRPMGEQRPPSIHTLKESGAIEQDADGLLFVYRESDDRGKLLDDGFFIVRKSRMGTTGFVDFGFNAAQQNFKVKEKERDWRQRKDLG